MINPEEPAVTRHCAAHGHALIGGEGLGEQALSPGAHRRGQIRVRQGGFGQLRGVLLPRLRGAAQLALLQFALLQFASVHEQVNAREERLLGQNLLGGGTIGNTGAHAEALVLAVELFKSLTQQSEVGVCGALQNLRGVVAGVRRVNRGGKVDAARVGGQRQPGAVSAVLCGGVRGGAKVGSSPEASGCGSISYAHGGLSRSETGVWIRDEVCVGATPPPFSAEISRNGESRTPKEHPGHPPAIPAGRHPGCGKA